VVSPTLAETIEKCLEKAPEQRYQTGSELRSALLEAQHASLPVPAALEEDKPAASHRKLWVAAILSAVVLVAVITGILYRRAYPRFKLTNKDTIVLADFENKTGDEVLDGSLTEALRVGLEQTPFLNLLAADKVNRVAKQIGFANEQPLTSERARQVCLKTNSAAAVAGSISDAGNGYQLALRALRCDSGAVMASASGVTVERSGITTELGRAAVSLRKELGEPERTVQEFNQPLERAMTPSVEALKSYTVGRQARARNGDDAAVPFLSHAVELDPNFAMAHSLLGSVLASDPARRARQRAYDLRGRVTKRQCFEVMGKYFELVTGDEEQAAKLWEEALQIYPNDPNFYSHLGYSLRVLGKHDEAVPRFREAIRLDPENMIPYSNLMDSEIAMGKYSEADATFDEARLHGIDNSQLRSHREVSALLENDKPAMEEQLAAMRQMGPAWVVTMFQAWSEIAFGHLKSFRQLWTSDEMAKVGSQYPETAAEFLAEMAIIESEVGDFAIATKHAEAALAHGSRYEKFQAAYALARAGNIDEAQQAAQQLKTEAPDDTQVKDFVPCVEVMVAMNQNAMDEAMRLLQTGCPDNPVQPEPVFGLNSRYVRGLSYLKMHEAKNAKIAFQSAIGHIAQLGDLGPFYGALARFQLARAYAMMGDKDAARKSYQDFLTLWKDADPDIPIYKQAKAESAKLH
jgi:tetratricopeptide (TPR) repeat protein